MEFAPYLFITGGKCEEALNFYKGFSAVKSLK